ncbi:hypothetical protein FNW02_21825 [Komarekiella sp. 'clone 1']|uniref:Uncharacterized protein n=1 Tax=Komarekiella delphini-convector SJRDD-AB1 TaxID=2593771 RepID=A0AA40VSP7_9NOST|nr:hypothetical protein [Komarekiella delphini-convector]MBD6618390.1 hypothetical protein [Komarekiella delphini-convector SJRDD-AB1]
MQHLHQLLKIENSKLAQLLRFSLYGLEATLNQARTEFPLDPGSEICDEVLQELHSLLQPAVAAPLQQDSGWEDMPLPNALKLSHLREAFDSDPELGYYLGNSPLQSQTDSDLWNEIQRKLLRVPEDLATSWRQRSLALAQEAGARENNSNLYQLPFFRDEIIYPGLSGTVRARGLCLSQKALSNSEIVQNNESGNLYLLAGLLLICIKFIELDPDLHHALKSVFGFDVISLYSNPEQQNQYINALGDRFERTQKAEENAEPLLTLRAWIDMDEAIHSLVFVPPAERYSWWGKLQQESRRILKKVADQANAAGYEVRIRQLSGLYADICALSKDDLQLNCGGVPGEVLTCLRLYARINQEESLGRVLFRSSR